MHVSQVKIVSAETYHVYQTMHLVPVNNTRRTSSLEAGIFSASLSNPIPPLSLLDAKLGCGTIFSQGDRVRFQGRRTEPPLCKYRAHDSILGAPGVIVVNFLVGFFYGCRSSVDPAPKSDGSVLEKRRHVARGKTRIQSRARTRPSDRL